MRCFLFAAFACHVVAHLEQKQDIAVRQQLMSQVLALIPDCVSLCKSLNEQLPKGHPQIDPTCARCAVATESAGDLGNADSCFDKFCRTPGGTAAAEGCPNEGFLECVKEQSSLLQVKSLPETPVLLNQLTALQRAMSVSVNGITIKRKSLKGGR